MQQWEQEKFSNEWQGPQTAGEWAQLQLRRLWIREIEQELLDPLRQLEAIRKIEQFADLRKNLVVSDAREAGKTWQQIGDALGITRQGAQKQWGYVDRRP